MRGATKRGATQGGKNYISIHAPLAGCDPHECRAPAGHSDFNPRTPCGVRRSGTRHDGHCPYFNPRTPCGVRPTSPPSAATITYFNPRAPCGARPDPSNPVHLVADISIHAPLAGCDSGDPTHRSAPPYFNPRTPCGVRRIHTSHGTIIRGFQSTHPLRGATSDTKGHFACPLISIHAPLAGCDHLRRYTYRANSNFNPRAPCGVRLPKTYADMLNFVFQSTRPLRGATEDAL